RHTRCYRDWSSDVCSSDLFIEALNRDIEVEPRTLQILALLSHVTPMMARALTNLPGDDAPVARIANLKSDCPGIGGLYALAHGRSEERRVGKEGRGRRYKV